MYATHSLAEWFAFLLLGVGAHGALSVPYFLTVDADLADFDPRPAVSRVLESGRLDVVLVSVANARYDAREFVTDGWQFAALSLRDAALSGAALLALLFPVAGGTR